jgi:PEP-CTERM motif-containing protein
MKQALMVLVCVLALVTGAHASMIYALVGGGATPLGGGNFQWEYSAQLSDDQKLDSTSFGVVYDFPGFVSATSTALVGGITVSTVTELTTSPQPVNQSVGDSATLTNIRTNVTGTFDGAGLTPVYLVDIISTIDGAPSLLVMQSAQALKDAPGDASDNSLTGNTARIEGPSTVVPEPSTLFLLGSGLAFVGRRLHRGRQI